MGARTVIAGLALTLCLTSAASERTLYHEVAHYVGVPADLLYAMAQAESGRATAAGIVPWPWTLNIEGEGQFYPSRAAMFTALMTALGQERLRVDIGPLQLNWYWQYERIHSPWRITDPAVNAKVAAELLKSHHARSGDWRTAVGHYHRPRQRSASDRAIAERYRQRVWSLLEGEGAHAH